MQRSFTWAGLTVSPNHLEYLAGLFDGEGHIVTGGTLHGKERTYRFSLQLSMVRRAGPEMCLAAFGGSIYLQDRSHKPGWRNCWCWYVGGKAAEVALGVLKPSLVIKYDEAVIALNYAATCGRGASKVSPTTQAYREALVKEIKLVRWAV